jgi:hypothetical protein
MSDEAIEEAAKELGDKPAAQMTVRMQLIATLTASLLVPPERYTDTGFPMAIAGRAIDHAEEVADALLRRFVTERVTLSLGEAMRNRNR